MSIFFILAPATLLALITEREPRPKRPKVYRKRTVREFHLGRSY